MTRVIVRTTFVCTVLTAMFARATLLPPQFPDAVVALGSMKPYASPGQPCFMRWATEGTGFFYGYLVKNDPDPGKRRYEVYLVTNRHVIEEHAAAVSIAKARQAQGMQIGAGCAAVATTTDSISVRINPVGSSSLSGRTFELPINDWFFHPNPNIDISAVRLNGEFLKAHGLLGLFFTNDRFVANKEKMKALDVSAGDDVFVLGFPMNLAGPQRNYVIVRRGSIARIADLYDGRSTTYLLDTFVFPGNSGSPVILRPEMASITGTPPQMQAYLIGIVTSYLPYDDVAIDQQTGRPRVVFEENAGLAEVLPTDYIDEAIATWRKSHH